MKHARHGVVVAVEGRPHEIHAVRWGAAEAALRQTPVTLVHVVSRLVVEHPAHVVVWTELDRWAQLVRLTVPEVTVVTSVTDGRPDDELTAFSERAELLVLGTDTTRRPELMLGSLMDRVAVHAQCPVAVVGPTPLADLRPGCSPATQVVAVIVDLSEPLEHRVVHFAAHEAALHGAELLIVTTRDGAGPDAQRPATPSSTAHPVDRATPLWSSLTDVIAYVQQELPSLTVRQREVEDLVASRVLATVDLIVVGSHHSDELWAIDCGRAAMRALDEARCPVLLVPPAGELRLARPPTITRSPLEAAGPSGVSNVPTRRGLEGVH